VPRYQYRCTQCEHICVIQHLSDETVSICPECNKDEALVKQLTSFSTRNSKTLHRAKVGDVTEEYIQSAREELKQQKKELQTQEKD
jgi:putative FmdB family regulatory protein